MAIDKFLIAKTKANRIKGMSVAIVQGNNVVFSKGYGEAESGKPNTPETQFFIGSVSKSFTSLAAMQLVQQGKLDLDAPIQKYLPWFQVADPGASSKITVRQLLNHTSGLSEKGDPNASVYTSSLEEQGRLLRTAHLSAPIGKQYRYYNQNYRLVGLLVETVSGLPFSEYIRVNIFNPLGMTNSTTDPTLSSNLAQGYSRVFGFPLPKTQEYIPGALPSGYLISTANDMARFLLAQINNTRIDGQQLLDPELLTIMRTVPAGINSNYGMGWLVLNNGDTIANGGALEYFQAFVLIHLKEKTGLVILFNQNGIENTMIENNDIRDGLLKLLEGTSPNQFSYGWIGWLLMLFAIADLINQIRLFIQVIYWKQDATIRINKRVIVSIVIGLLLPICVVFGFPLIVKLIQGGSPSWSEPIKIIPDLTIWLLAGMSLNFVRNILRAVKFAQMLKK